MTVTADDLVRREVHYCVSSLVSTLAQANWCEDDSQALEEMKDQALELALPIDDWEEAARQEGWRTLPDKGNGVLWTRDARQADIDNEDGAPVVDSAQEACEFDHVDPYQREIYEHWIVSDWLADKLAEKGEKVDKDFAGLTVWARTTTGQAISQDSVIQEIVAEINAA